MTDFQIPVFASLVGILADWMRIALQICYDFTESMGFPSYGVAIIILTILIKLILLPLALKQIRSMKGMQEIQPKIQAIQKKYKNDRARMSAEMQKLYQENGVSPLAGCLPLLIQMPFLVSIYYALQGYPYDPAHESFLWLESLAAPDATYVLPALSALSTFVISWQTTPKNVQGSQKTMLYFMPLFIGYISLNFPSGLVLYWVVCNIFQLVQQTIMFRDEYIGGGSKKGVVTVHAASDGKKKAAKKPAVKKAPAKKAAPKKDAEETAEAGKPAAKSAPKEESKPASKTLPDAEKTSAPADGAETAKEEEP